MKGTAMTTGPSEEGVETRVVDLTGVSLQTLQGLSEEDLGPTLTALQARVDSPGASISGYNGAGPLTRDATAKLVVGRE
jgi:hypothetical protein